MRAMLIANPKATSASRRARDLFVRAFSGELNLEIATTGHRGHATQLARKALDEQYDLVIALGGDGTINEAVNGLLTHGPSPDLPALAVLPSGSANVFARALGLPNDPHRSAKHILTALRTDSHRNVGLGLADDRYFTFSGGVGLDAEVVRVVEALRLSGARAYPTLYLRTLLRQFFAVTDRRRPALTVECPGLPPVSDLFLAVVSNTAPWTYLGPFPINPSPLSGFDSGLAVFGARSLDVRPVLHVIGQMMLPHTTPRRGGGGVSLHDATEVTIRSSRPIAFQLDGDYLGEREEVVFRSVPNALRIVV
ncbi:diacylglycerol kinase family lipid kinase [Actinomadura alba]|uniref:Diacylglycerol kinase family lipid kinase n=2 Tax=Actinomadura alba TaxID=406431 RepID=A0ABR7LY78_9ACTN|nr:diacylglycerol kinase family lipid kinase [Actinomadura alba]